MPRKKIPSELEVLGKLFTIEVTTDMGKSCWGETEVEERSIRINANRDPDTWRSTLLHEILHAILGITGQDETLKAKKEEGLVKALEQGLIDLIDFKDF